MPELIFDLVCEVDALATEGDLELSVGVQNDVQPDDDALRCDAAIDGTAGAMAFPTGLLRQRAGMEVWVGGVQVPPSLLAGIEVSRSLNEHLQRWSFTIRLDTAAGQFGSPFDGSGGPRLCKSPVDIYGVYRTSTGLHRILLINDGIVDSSARDAAGKTETFHGVDRGGNFDRETVSLVLPPGHGLTRDRVVAILSKRAGDTRHPSLITGKPMLKEFQVVETQFMSPAQDLADLEGRRLMYDRNGTLVWRKSGRLSAETPQITLGEAQWIRGSVRTAHPSGEVITRVIVDGEEQKIREVCGDETATQEIKELGIEGPSAPAYLQNVGDDYDPNDQPLALSVPITMKLEILESVRRCGVLVYERRRCYTYMNPEVTRYEWNAGTTSWDTLASVYTDDDASGDAPAFAWHLDRWNLTELDETWHYWLRQGFRGLGVPFMPAYGPMFDYPLGLSWSTFIGMGDSFGAWEGLKIGTLERSWRWKVPQAYLKARTWVNRATPWEEIDPDSLAEVMGDKRAPGNTAIPSGFLGSLSPKWTPSQTGARFLPEVQRATFLGANIEGFQTRKEVYEFGYAAKYGPQPTSGTHYLFGDGTERIEESEVFRFLGAEFIDYLPEDSDDSHAEITARIDLDGNPLSGKSHTGIPSYLPAAERIPDSGRNTDDDVYADDYEVEQAVKRAYRTEGRPFSVDIVAAELEWCHTKNVAKLISAYAENEEEAEALAYDAIDESAAVDVQGTVAGANFFLEPSYPALFRERSIDLDNPGRIITVRWSWRPGEPLNTEVEGKVYVW